MMCVCLLFLHLLLVGNYEARQFKRGNKNAEGRQEFRVQFANIAATALSESKKKKKQM